MTQYVSILRGINVSGQKMIVMGELKSLYEGEGLIGVFTYIQSGNVVFESEISDPLLLQTQLESAIEKQYGFQVPVQVLPLWELNDILEAVPFEGVTVEVDGAQVLISFLSEAPGSGAMAVLEGARAESESVVIKGRAVYLHCPNGYGKTKLSNVFLEKKLGLIATTRNLKTVAALVNLADS